MKDGEPMMIKEAIMNLYEEEMKAYVDKMVEDIVRCGHQSEEEYLAELEFARSEAENAFVNQIAYDIFNHEVDLNRAFVIISK